MNKYSVLMDRFALTDELIEKIKTKIKILLLNGKGFPADAVREADGSRWSVDLTLPVDWSCPKAPQRSYKFWINGFFFVDNLYFEYEESGNHEDGRRILSYMLDWAEQNHTYDKSAEWPWYDDATANRLFRWCLYYLKLKELCSSEECDRLESSFAYQAELLFSDEFYKPQHNNGMHQDMALIVYALFYGKGEQKAKYIERALARTGEYLDFIYAPDGIHKEHSPFYATDVLMDAKLLCELVEEVSPDFSAHVQPYVEGGQEFLLQIIQPDGAWPSLGDSSRTPSAVATFQHYFQDNKEYQYIASHGEEGVPPGVHAVFAEGGYAIFRSPWEEEQKGTWMLFNAATHSSVHKHGDDLEVLLYHRGELFVEAGKRNFNYTAQETAWAYSGYGHNVLLVNGEAYPVKVGQNGFQSIYPKALQTRITDWGQEDSFSYVTGYQCRFPGVEQERTLIYDRLVQEVRIEDSIKAEEEFAGTLLWHIAEGVHVKELANGWAFYRRDVFVARAEVTADVPCKLETVGADGEYPYAPWIFNGNDDPAYGTLLKVNFEGKAGLSKVVLRVSFQEHEGTETTSWETETYWGQVYRDSICNSRWLLDETVSPGRMAVGYNVLYVLYRALNDFHPMHILELGFGQSTRLTSQYAPYANAQHIVVEHDPEWIEFFRGVMGESAEGLQIHQATLLEKGIGSQKYFAYEKQDIAEAVQRLGGKCDLILVDAPFGGKGSRARCDIIPHLPGILADDFAIMVDDCGRRGETNTILAIKKILNENNIEFAARLYQSDGEKHVWVIASKSWRFLASV